MALTKLCAQLKQSYIATYMNTFGLIPAAKILRGPILAECPTFKDVLIRLKYASMNSVR
jgi:hypothetical protein